MVISKYYGLYASGVQEAEGGPCPGPEPLSHTSRTYSPGCCSPWELGPHLCFQYRQKPGSVPTMPLL